MPLRAVGERHSPLELGPMSSTPSMTSADLGHFSPLSRSSLQPCTLTLWRVPFSHQRPKHLFLVHHAESKPDFIDDLMATATATAASASSFASTSTSTSTSSKGSKGGKAAAPNLESAPGGGSGGGGSGDPAAGGAAASVQPSGGESTSLRERLGAMVERGGAVLEKMRKTDHPISRAGWQQAKGAPALTLALARSPHYGSTCYGSTCYGRPRSCSSLACK